MKVHEQRCAAGSETFLPGCAHLVARSRGGLSGHCCVSCHYSLGRTQRLHLCVLWGHHGYAALLARLEVGAHLESHPSRVSPVAELRQLLAPCVGHKKARREELLTPREIYPAELPRSWGSLLGSW